VRARVIAGLAAAVLAIGLVPAVAGASAGRPYRIRLDVSALGALSGAFYEVWVVAGERKISAGSFNVSADGELVDGFGHEARFFSTRNPASADAIVVTIEPLPDPDAGPSGIIVLAGAPRRSGTARLRFPVRFNDASGTFILATPTNTAMNDETAGVWFLDPAAGPGPSLDVPMLPAGWVYEGWGVTQGTPLSTGRFDSPSGVDDAAPFSGPQPGPPFPGEDFLNNLPAGVAAPVDLADGSSSIVLTVEPDLAGTDPTGPAPFSIKPLLTMVAAGAADHTSIALGLDLSTVPSGAARF
jgi:hypothetical protein